MGSRAAAGPVPDTEVGRYRGAARRMGADLLGLRQHLRNLEAANTLLRRDAAQLGPPTPLPPPPSVMMPVPVPSTLVRPRVQSLVRRSRSQCVNTMPACIGRDAVPDREQVASSLGPVPMVATPMPSMLIEPPQELVALPHPALVNKYRALLLTN